MGKINKETTDHYISKMFITKCSICRNCPMKMYHCNTDKIIYGIGNIQTDTIFVLPPYDTRNGVKYNTILEKLKEVYKEITSLDILERYYVTRIIKCLDRSNYGLNDKASESCVNNFIREINIIKPRKIIFFGDSYIYAFNNLFHKVETNILLVNVISPAVFYYENDKLKDKFVEQLNKAIYG